MNHFIIDTTDRAVGWRTVLAGAYLVAQGGRPYTLADDDVIFAHSHDDDRVRNSDFVVNREPVVFPRALGPERRIVEFQQKVRDAVGRRCIPTLILYSGDGLAGRRVADWKEAVNRVAIPGFPVDRIEVIENHVVSRNAGADELRPLIEAFADRFHAGGLCDINAALRFRRQSNHLVEALCLLCHEWESGGGPLAPKTEWLRECLQSIHQETSVEALACLTDHPRPFARALFAALDGGRQDEIQTAAGNFLRACER